MAINDTSANNFVTFNDLEKHFKQKYNIDLYEVTKKPYFNFWHWLLSASEHIPFTTTSNEHWKILPLSHDLVVAPSESVMRSRALYAQVAKMHGMSVDFPSDGINPDEAPAILDMIFKDFGQPLDLYMKVDR
jgi:hypothetical protein